MKSITITLTDDYYSRFETLAKNLNKTIEEYAVQTIENKTDAFSTVGFRGEYKSWTPNSHMKK